MDYRIGQTYEFEVVRDFGENDDMFRLRVPGYSDFFINKLKFQRGQPAPVSLACRVKSVGRSGPVLGHCMPMYVRRFYGDAFARREPCEFTVYAEPAMPSDPYVLEDANGLRFNLYQNTTPLTRGRSVVCRFTRLNSAAYSLELCESGMKLPLLTPADLLARIGTRGAGAGLTARFLAERPELAAARAELAAANPSWVVTALKAASEALPDYFRCMDIRRHWRLMERLLGILRSAALYIIEGSGLLRQAPESVRRSVQEQMTALVEGLKPYNAALGLFATDGIDGFITSLMEKLRQAGYLYRPVDQFATLMLIFRTDTSLVKKYLGGIFDTIMEWNLETWTQEPFRTAFVRQFEIYIRLSCREVDRLPQAQTESENDRLQKIVTAIALQMLIGGKNPEGESARRNRALFYRYISLLRPGKSDVLLDKSYATLLGARLPVEFGYDDIKEPQLMMTKASVSVGGGAAKLPTRLFRAGNVEITAGDDGISIKRAGDADITPVLPSTLMPWLSPQVYLDGIRSLNGSRINSFDAHRQMWSDIEKVLFEKTAKPEGEMRERRRAEEGDQVAVIIDPREIAGGDDPQWRCRIDDPSFLPGEGYINRSDIVAYSLRGLDLDRNRTMIEQAFRDDSGAPLHFIATVIGIDSYGRYRMSLTDDAAAQAPALLDYNRTYHGVVTWVSPTEYLVIGDCGYGVYLSREADRDLRPGDVVDFRVLDHSNPAHLEGTILGLSDDGVKVDKSIAFVSLLNGLAVVADGEPGESEDVDDGPDEESLAREDVDEIVQLLRFKSLTCSKLLSAFDYLRYARLLALATGDSDMAANLLTHASLLHQHQFYASNSRIDAAELEARRAEAAASPLLQIIFHRLEIVSWLGDSSRNESLWATINTPRNNLENTLARMVLSYNMLPEEGRPDNTIAKGLKAEIARLLGVNFEPRVLKSYGSENQFVEFKSSIVYPARKSASDKVEADPDRQQHVLLRTVAGFMNASGGTLYIGVNDSTHCEAGLFEDFEYYKRHKGIIGSNHYEIRTPDNVCNFLTNLVRQTWGTLVTESVQIEPDPEATRDVIVVKIQPRVAPVELDGVIYVRRSGTTMRLDESERDEFEQERRARGYQRRAEEAAAPAAIAAPQPASPAVQAAPAVPARVRIATSAWRPNVLHDGEEGFVEPAGYLYFTAGNTLSHSQRDFYREDELPLVMAFSPEEARSGSLLLMFDSQRLLRVPLSEILEKPSNREVSYFRESLPLFATVASPGDALNVYLTDTKDNLYRRTLRVSEIPAGHLTSAPERILDMPAGPTVACELVASPQTDSFAASLASNLSGRQIGYTMRCQAGSDKAAELIAADTKKASQPK